MIAYRKTGRPALLAGAAALALVIGAPHTIGLGENQVSFVATAEAQSRVTISYFFETLAPHGRWVRHHAHGWVWTPVGVRSDWRPYVDGYWVHTDRYGWFWVSFEPFGGVVYRYGRWGYHPAYGWYWVPGHIWAPAWVTWRVGSGYVGWAPLAPERRGYAWYYPRRHRPPVAESWVFVEVGFVHSPELRQHVVPVRQIPEVIVVADQRINIDIHQNVVINRPIEREQFAEFGIDLRSVDIQFVDDPAAADVDVDVDVTQISAFRAEIEPVAPPEAPLEALETPEEIDQPALLEQVLDEVPAEAEAPSVAQIDVEQIEADLEEEMPPDEAPEALDELTEEPAEVPEEPELPEELDAEPEPEPEVPDEAPEAPDDLPAEPDVEPAPEAELPPEPEPEADAPEAVPDEPAPEADLPPEPRQQPEAEAPEEPEAAPEVPDELPAEPDVEPAPEAELPPEPELEADAPEAVPDEPAPEADLPPEPRQPEVPEQLPSDEERMEEQ